MLVVSNLVVLSCWDDPHMRALHSPPQPQGGVSFFHLAMDSANGDMDLLEKCLEGMNREVEEV